MRVEVDARNEKLGYRLREAQIAKVPYQIVLGDGEVENGTVTIRQAGSKKSTTLSLDEALAKFKKEVDDKCLYVVE
jgi:threonyl-tRNA synthetase